MKTIQYSKWISIPLFVRQQIAKEFGISKIRSISVINNVVVDDGYEVHSVENSMTVEAMQTFTGSKVSDANELLSLVVNKVEGKDTPVQEIVEKEETPEEAPVKITKKRVTKTKK